MSHARIFELLLPKVLENVGTFKGTPPSFLVKSFLKIVSLFMCSGDRLGVDTSITVSMRSIGRTVKFLSILRETYFSENCQNFCFMKN